MTFVSDYFDKANSTTFGVSILVHGICFAALQYYGNFFQLPQYDVDRGASHVSIELVDAPASVETKAARQARPEPHPDVPLKAEKENHLRDASDSLKSEAGAQTLAQPDYLRNPPPVYPQVSRVRGEQGVVMLRVEVSQDGMVKALDLRKSSGFERLDDAAVRTVRHWSFQPAKMGGVAVASVVEIPIRFKIDSI